jgi:hypothetical protein
LWGTTLTLKALCQWRLGQYSQALQTAKDARTTAADQVLPRDRAILAALPGLIKTDQAYGQILGAVPGDHADLLNDVTKLLNGAIGDIQDARNLVDPDHPVQVYLIQAQLAAYRNFVVANDRLRDPPKTLTTEPERQFANANLKELERVLKKVGPEAAAEEVANKWMEICALDSLLQSP